MEIVVAKTMGNVIGSEGFLPWHIPEDLRHFREKTLGGSVIMGRRTWDEIYNKLGKALPKRQNIVLTSSPLPAGVEASAASSLAQAFSLARHKPIIIGGAQLYAATLPQMKVIHLTEVLGNYQGDAYFPELDKSEWDETIEEETDRYRFIKLIRK